MFVLLEVLVTHFKNWRHLLTSSSSQEQCKHRFQLSLHIFCGHKGELFNLLEDCMNRLDAVDDCTESTSYKNLFQENILQAHMKYAGFSQESESSYYKFLVWSFDPSAKDKWTFRLDHSSFTSWQSHLAWNYCHREEGNVHQGHSSKQLGQLWSELSQSPCSFMSKFQFQRRTVNPSIKENSWTVMISHKSSIHYKSILHFYKPDQC